MVKPTEEQRDGRRRLHPNAKYDWARWFARRRFSLVEGRDFAVSPYVMSVQVHNAARRYVPGRRVEVVRRGPEDGPARLDVRVTDRSPRAVRAWGGPPRADRQAA